ncbi:MAG: hypothetical protein RMH84_00590 [Sulfolobales archaeon]|nr:hypothetical protein [Sulfolobales archaeon]
MVRASCGSGLIAFMYLERCLDESILKLVSRLCRTEVLQLNWKCLISGVKISRDLPYIIQQNGCTYFEISQKHYVGILPGYIDAQCVLCGSSLRCRYGLQKRACSPSGRVEVSRHLDIEQIKGLVLELSGIGGDCAWCVTEEGSIRYSYL